MNFFNFLHHAIRVFFFGNGAVTWCEVVSEPVVPSFYSCFALLSFSLASHDANVEQNVSAILVFQTGAALHNNHPRHLPLSPTATICSALLATFRHSPPWCTYTDTTTLCSTSRSYLSFTVIFDYLCSPHFIYCSFADACTST